ncbi:Uncharacterized conserved protein, DUF983 family [Rhizobium sp. RU36D]|nr:Uncharacterized conserved protein, DUF983 family [Rhizobium sp. RU36D]
MSDDKTLGDDAAMFAPVEPLKAGLSACCPRCGQGRLFDGVVKLKPACSNCGLDYSFADSGDGPAIFVILIADCVMLGLALWTEFNLHPPIWLHILLWGPLTIGLSIWLLRTIKATLIALQFRNNARQGTIDHG